MGDLTPAAGSDYGEVLWAPTAQSAGSTEIVRYARWLADHGGPDTTAGPDGLPSYQALWQWSVDDPAAFWTSIWDFFGVLGTRGDGPVLSGDDAADRLVHRRPQSTTPGTRCCEPTSIPTTSPSSSAPKAAGRAGSATASSSSGWRASARPWPALGVGAGDRVAAYLPNSPEALIALLATASLGAIWSSCSPDFGAHSVIDRFAQITPVVLLARQRLRLQRQALRPARRAGRDRRRAAGPDRRDHGGLSRRGRRKRRGGRVAAGRSRP